MAFSKVNKKGSTKSDKTPPNDDSMKDQKFPTKISIANTTRAKPKAKPKKTVSILSLSRELRQQIFAPEFDAYIPLEVTYRRRGEALGHIDKLAGLYKRAIPECIEDVNYVAKQANQAVEELLEDPKYYC